MRDFFSCLTGQNISLKAAVASHIRSLLNTRRGSLRHMPDYGMPEYDFTQDEYIAKNHFIDALKQTIERYEPRIRSLQITEIQSRNADCVLELELHAILIDDLFSLAAFLLNAGDIVVLEHNEQ